MSDGRLCSGETCTELETRQWSMHSTFRGPFSLHQSISSALAHRPRMNTARDRKTTRPLSSDVSRLNVLNSIPPHAARCLFQTTSRVIDDRDKTPTSLEGRVSVQSCMTGA